MLAVPFVVFIGVAIVVAREPLLQATLELERTRVLEGEGVTVTVSLHNDGRSVVEVELELLAGSHLALEPGGTVLLRLNAGTDTQIRFMARPERWGAHAIGPLVVRARDQLGIATWNQRLERRIMLRAFPREHRLRELVAPVRTQPFLGTQVSRTRGDGIEFADVRPFVVGDRVRQVNWRATARRGSLYVTERHPEHASDVVLLVDTFAEARHGTGGTLDAAVRPAASVARAHLARRDRVALVDFGGTLQWLEPAFGTIQLYRILDALLSSEIAFSYAWRAVESIPRRVLPPAALILAISPLLDDRSIRLITELRTRRSDVAVIEVSPLTHTPPGRTVADSVAYRLWRLQRDALRARLRAMGIAVALWQEDDELGPTLEGVNSFRRSAQHVKHA